jgi:uncharacterized protein
MRLAVPSAGVIWYGQARVNAERKNPPLELLILQPTPFCNINCSYCYLPGRATKGRMSEAVIAAACKRVVEAGRGGQHLSVVWHAGEPLVLPTAYYQAAIATVANHLPPETQIEHHFQTNATLITADWCRFFATPGVRVGVSVDGPEHLHDRHRRTRSDAGTFHRVVGGIRQLQAVGIPFHAISVLTRASLERPDEMYDFFVAHGISDVSFNIEEIEGENLVSSLSAPGSEHLYMNFFTRFLERVSTADDIRSVREFETAFGRLLGPGASRGNQQAEPFRVLSVAVNGDFSTFSPELLGTTHARWPSFVIGNVLRDSLDDAASGSRFQAMHEEIARGLARCRETCDYFDLCGGGAPANKLAETGRFDATETLYCSLSVKAMTEVALAEIERGGRSVRVD